MATTNVEIVRKADLSVSQLASDGGKMPIEKAREFFARAISQSKILPLLRYEEMMADEKELPDLAFAGRVLKPKSSGDALPASDRVRPSIGKGTLQAKEFGFEVKVPRDVLEENIEGEGMTNTLQGQLEIAIARDVEDIVLNGDTASADAFLAKMDGLIKLCATNTIAAGGVNLSDSVLEDLYLTMPKEARGAIDKLVVLTSNTAEFRWKRSFAARMTAFADDLAKSGGSLPFHAIPVMGADLMPETLGGGSNETVALLVHKENAAYGFRRQVRINGEWVGREDAYYLYGSLKVATCYVHEPHTAKATGVLSI